MAVRTQPVHSGALMNDFLTHNTTALRNALTAAEELLEHHFRTAAQPCGSATAAELTRAVREVDLDNPTGDLPSALAELSPLWLDHAVWYHHPYYASHLNCPIAASAVAGETIATSLNTAVESWDQAGAAAVMELHLLDWVCAHIGWEGPGVPKNKDDETTPPVRGVFTSGGTQSNLQALYIAREKALRVLSNTGLSHQEKMGRLRFLTSEDTHYSVARAVRLLGLGDEALLTMPAPPTAPGTICPQTLSETLDRAEKEGLTVAAVVATAGTTDRGAIDPLLPIGNVCAEHATHLHVDAAYGGALLVSPTARHRLRGIELADSVTVDFHKGFYQPVACSAVVFRNPADLGHVTHHADYLNPQDSYLTPQGSTRVNLADYSLQTTRRFDALKLWVTLRTHGSRPIGEAFDRCCELAANAAEQLREFPNLRLVASPELSTLLFAPADPQAGPQKTVESVREQLMAQGRALVATTVVETNPCFKLTILDPALTPAELRGVLAAVSDQLDRQRPFPAAT
ncbi:pyridoxal-dependent decarboxylase [Corynebacterium heidelbergense]|uniref:Pyridoxal-dependent decarboxylase n=2 Tax=Corynebacterium heidelbergense TaxID=2055947 RepID=A0A364V9P7_9CORY|nr:pyridoxal-dependent decarboxylase [Corynebacterium heidelbergense]